MYFKMPNTWTNEFVCWFEQENIRLSYDIYKDFK